MYLLEANVLIRCTFWKGTTPETAFVPSFLECCEFFSHDYGVKISTLFPTGLSNIIGMIVYISANAGDPSKSDSKKNSYSYGWSFYFGALSFIMAEMVGVLAVHMFIDRHRELRVGARAADYLQGSAITRIPSYRYRYRRRSRSSSRSTDPSHSRDASPVGLKGFGALPSTEISMYTLTRGGDTLKGSHGTPTATYNSERDHNFLQVHNCIQKDLKDSSQTNTANRRTTPVWGTTSPQINWRREQGREGAEAPNITDQTSCTNVFSLFGETGRIFTFRSKITHVCMILPFAIDKMRLVWNGERL